MLTDLISAKPEDAEVILRTSGHATTWPTLEAKTVDQIKLTSLAFLLQGKPLDGPDFNDYVKSFKPLAVGGDDGPWIDQLPEGLVRDLAALPDDRIPALASAWAATEEAILDRWDANDVVPFLKELASFAGAALAQERGLLLWYCL